jgi:hypothetical protein
MGKGSEKAEVVASKDQKEEEEEEKKAGAFPSYLVSTSAFSTRNGF